MTTYWQGELNRFDKPFDYDFERRASAEAALADVRDRLDLLTESERKGVTGGAAEWDARADGISYNTGRYMEFSEA